MKLRFILSLLCGLFTVAFAQDLQPTSVTLTKGSLSFDAEAVTFRTKDKEQRYAFPKLPISRPGPTTPEIPGLRIHSFEYRVKISPGGGPEKDASQLSLTASDGSSIELIAGQTVEVYRIEVTFAAHRNVTLWKLASQLK